MKRFLLMLMAIFGLQAYQPSEVSALKELVLHGFMSCKSYGGWCSSEKTVSFIDLVLEVKPRVCVEIGVCKGASLCPVAAALKFLGNGVVIGIDPWDFYECIRYFDPVADEATYRWWATIDQEEVYNIFLSCLHQLMLEPYCKVLRMTSVEAAQEIDVIDILHIDGDHSEKMSLIDVQLYLPKVRSGGYIWLNDALWKERGDAVDLLLEYCDVVKCIDSANCLLFKKR